MRRRTLLLVVGVVAALVVASGVALAAVREGGPGDDTLIGTNGADNIDGKGGDDTLKGLGGGDWLTGDRGRDTLKGQADGDELWGGPARDSLYGGSGGRLRVGRRNSVRQSSYKSGRQRRDLRRTGERRSGQSDWRRRSRTSRASAFNFQIAILHPYLIALNRFAGRSPKQLPTFYVKLRAVARADHGALSSSGPPSLSSQSTSSES